MRRIIVGRIIMRRIGTRNMTAIYIDDTPTQNNSFSRIILRRIILRGIGTQNMTAMYIDDTPTQNNSFRRIILRKGEFNIKRKFPGKYLEISF